jgi:uncharacterized membrane protein
MQREDEDLFLVIAIHIRDLLINDRTKLLKYLNNLKFCIIKLTNVKIKNIT